MEKRLYCSPNKKICGVCAGIADYCNIDVTIVRLIFCLVGLFTAFLPTFLVYLIIALIIPKPPENYYEIYNNTAKRLTKGTDKKICGVCSGIAEYFGIDPTIIRLIFVAALILFGTGAALYIICAIVMPQAFENTVI